MTVSPLCIVLSLPHLRSSSDFDQAIAGEVLALDARASETHVPDDLQLALTHEPAAPVIVNPKSDETRVAMLPTTARDARTLDAAPLERAAAIPKASRMPNLVPPSVVSTEPKPIEDSVPDPVTIQQIPVPPVVEKDVAIDASLAAEAAARKAERDALDAEMNVALTDKTAHRPTATHFNSTGHLTMVNPRAGAIAGTRLPPNVTPNVTPPTTTRETSTKHRRKPREEAAAVSDSAADVAMSADGVWPAADNADAFGTNAAPALEDVILQQPLENRRVNRVESVVAVTRAKGWPIALVRSNLPDDFWWVQQMVGIRGNAFAARVNFGNDASLPGSVYHMVVVFLDSPDEVRRFRIAKKFKELPEGARHSREFTFVRQ